MKLEDRKYIWYMYQLQRTVDTISKIEAVINGDKHGPDNSSDSWDERAIEQASLYIKERLRKWNLDLIEAEKIERNLNQDELNSEGDSNSITSFGSADYAHSQDSFDDIADFEDQPIKKKKPAARTSRVVSAWQEETTLQEQVVAHVREK